MIVAKNQDATGRGRGRMARVMSIRPLGIARGVLAIMVIVPVTAAAQPADHSLGQSGQYLLTTDTRFDYRRTSYTRLDDQGDEVDVVHTRFDGGLAVDRVMFDRHITVGLHIGFESDTYEAGAGVRVFSTGVRFGKIVDIGGDGEEDFALWPRVGLDYGQISFWTAPMGTGGGTATEQVVRLELSLPLLYRPVSRVFLGGGPTFEYDLFARVGRDAPLPKTTTLGLQGVLGFWFHGY